MTIRKKGSKYVLKTKGGGRTLGTHSTKKGALRQERAIQMNKRKK